MASQLLLFLISPRIIDFDTFLPTALELKRAMPDSDVRFVTFSTENFDYVRKNQTHMAGLKQCGTLNYLGWEHETTWLRRKAAQLRTLLRISGWILEKRRPVLFLGLPFRTTPYAQWRFLARLRGGIGVMLWKYRSPDIALARFREVRKHLPRGRAASVLARLAGRSTDLFVHYHDREQENIDWARGYGSLDRVPSTRIGMPHWLPSWRRLIEKEAERYREELREDGLGDDVELYAMFPAKIWSAETLRDDDSIVWTFEKAFRRILKTRPKAHILLRPHPHALYLPYFNELLEEAGPERARICWAHPEVMFRLARRAVFNNPTNLIFSCYDGQMIDVSDYPEQHYQDFGDVSLAHGYGPVYVDPRSSDFDERFDKTLTDNSVFEDEALFAERRALMMENPPTIDALIACIENPNKRFSFANRRGVSPSLLSGDATKNV